MTFYKAAHQLKHTQYHLHLSKWFRNFDYSKELLQAQRWQFNWPFYALLVKSCTPGAMAIWITCCWWLSCWLLLPRKSGVPQVRPSFRWNKFYCVLAAPSEHMEYATKVIAHGGSCSQAAVCAKRFLSTLCRFFCIHLGFLKQIKLTQLFPRNVNSIVSGSNLPIKFQNDSIRMQSVISSLL